MKFFSINFFHTNYKVQCKVNAPICANLRLDLYLKIQNVKMSFRKKFCFI